MEITCHRENARIIGVIQVCRARMSGEFDSMKGTHSTKFKQMPQIFKKLSFRELCDSSSSGLHPIDKRAMIYWVKKRLKTER